MDRISIGLIGVGMLLGLLAVGSPIGVSLALVSFFGIWALIGLGPAWGIVTAVPFNFIGDWSFSAIPMFLLMGYIASSAKLTDDAFDVMRLLLRRVPGGLACATVGACTLFASASGSSVATAAAMSRIAVPRMLAAKYDAALAAGTVTSAGTLGAMIPPSILMILYGIFAEQSVSRLFMAAIIPGLLSAAGYILVIIIWSMINPKVAPRLQGAAQPGELRRALRGVWPFPILIAGVLGGIFFGVFTPTEAGAMGAFFTILIAMVRRTFSPAMLREAVLDTVRGTCTLFLIAIGAVLFTRFVALSGLPTMMSEFMLSVSTDPLMLLLQIALIYVILGMFIDATGTMLLTLPVIIPVLVAANVDLIWFGVVVIKLLEIGLVTPPVGLNLFVVKSTLGVSVSLGKIIKGTSLFLAMDILVLGLLVLIPALALYLPSLM